MNNNKLKKMKVALYLSILVIPFNSISYAAVVQQVVPPASINVQAGNNVKLPPLTTVVSFEDINSASGSKALRDQGCDPQVMYRLTNNYLLNRGMERNLELQTLVGEQANGALPAETAGSVKIGANGSPTTSAASCFQQAASNVNQVVSTANRVLSVLSGGGGFSATDAIKGAVNYASNAACQQVNNYTGQVVGGYTNPINGTANGGINQVLGTGVNTQYGSYNTGQILTGGGINPYGAPTATNVPYVNTAPLDTVSSASRGAVNNTVNNVSSGCDSLLSCNPFK